MNGTFCEFPPLALSTGQVRFILIGRHQLVTTPQSSDRTVSGITSYYNSWIQFMIQCQKTMHPYSFWLHEVTDSHENNSTIPIFHPIFSPRLSSSAVPRAVTRSAENNPFGPVSKRFPLEPRFCLTWRVVLHGGAVAWLGVMPLTKKKQKCPLVTSQMDNFSVSLYDPLSTGQISPGLQQSPLWKQLVLPSEVQQTLQDPKTGSDSYIYLGRGGCRF